MILSGLLTAPTYAYAAVTLVMELRFEINLILAAPILAYSVLVFFFLAAKTEKKAQYIEV
jgi:hypothetical protein